LGVFIYHTAQREEIAHPLVRRDAKSLGGCGIVEKLADLASQIGGISGFERAPGIAQDFNKGTEIRGQNGDSTQHILSNDHTKNFTAERGNDQKVGCGEQIGNLRVWQPPEKAHLRGKFPLFREFLKSSAFGAIADNLQLDRTILLLQETRSFDEQEESLGGNNAAQKNEHWVWLADWEPHEGR